MAVPKKRTSLSKRRSRFANWKKKASKQANKAFSIAKSLLRDPDNVSFVSNSKLKKIELELE